MRNKHVFITGVSSGIGLETLLLLAKHGFFVIGTVRDEQKREQVLLHAQAENVLHMIDLVILDITEHEQVTSIVEQVIKKHQKIDVLINNAGYCLGGFTEEVSIDEWKAQFDTNVFGTISVTQALLPYFRKQRYGRMIILSSIIGRIGMPSMGPYASSKFALKGFADSLRLELLQTGIDVTVVEPGSFQTKIWDKGLESLQRNESSLYGSERKAIAKLADKAFNQGKSPQVVAQYLLALCEKKHLRKQYVVGAQMKVLLLLFQIIPSTWIELYLKHVYKKEVQSS